MNTLVISLVEDLERVSNAHPEITDTDVREVMAFCVLHGFLLQTQGFRLPLSFVCINPLNDFRVRKCLKRFIRAARIPATAAELNTPELRFAALFDSRAVSSAGSDASKFFGPSSSLEEWTQAYRGYQPRSWLFKMRCVVGAFWTALRP